LFDILENLRTELAVLPPSNKVATIPDESIAIATFYFG